MEVKAKNIEYVRTIRKSIRLWMKLGEVCRRDRRKLVKNIMKDRKYQTEYPN